MWASFNFKTVKKDVNTNESLMNTDTDLWSVHKEAKGIDILSMMIRTGHHWLFSFPSAPVNKKVIMNLYFKIKIRILTEIQYF